MGYHRFDNREVMQNGISTKAKPMAAIWWKDHEDMEMVAYDSYSDVSNWVHHSLCMDSSLRRGIAGRHGYFLHYGRNVHPGQGANQC